MIISFFKSSLVMLSCIGLAACYPIYKTLQPELDVVVQDQQGQLLDQVPVVLMREPNVGLGYHYTLAKTQQGKAHFDRLSEWRVEFLMLHGVINYNWYLCVEQPGYEIQPDIAVKQAQMTVTLKKSTLQAKQPNPEEFGNYVQHCNELPRYEVNQTDQRE